MRRWFAIVTLRRQLGCRPRRGLVGRGPQLIAALAYDRLDPAVRAKVDARIKLNPDYSKRVEGPRTPIATVSPSTPFVVVRIACRQCSQRGSYRLARLAAKYGRDQPARANGAVLARLPLACRSAVYIRQAFQLQL